MGWLVRCHHILTRIPAMATPQTFQNPETKTSPYVTETRQTSRDRYVLPFTSTSKPPMSTSNQQQPPAATTSSNHHQHQQQPPATSSNQQHQQPAAPATSSSETRREGAVPPPEASTRCLRVASCVIHYMKPNERRGILVDENVRHPSCLVILLQYCNIMIYE